MKEKVVVIGGGVAGLTAAHELVERGFDVHLYERRPYCGGKAASRRANGGLPTEHGFRFFPSWYRHLPDTLGRIPYRGARSFRDQKTVLDNLIPVGEELLAWHNRDSLRIITHLPRSHADFKTVRSILSRLTALGLTADEVTFFGRRLTEFLLTSDAQRAAKWESITWWDYLDADNKSPAYRDLIAATTRLMVAAKAKDASAYSIGRLALRTFADALTTVDRILDGPTSEAWLDPWVEHLKSLGVAFHSGLELSSIACVDPKDGSAGSGARALSRIERVTFTPLVIGQVARIRRLVTQIVQYRLTPKSDDGDFQSRRGAGDSRKPGRVRIARLVKQCAALVEAVLDDPSWRAQRAQGRVGGNGHGGDAPEAAVFRAVDNILLVLDGVLKLRAPPSNPSSTEVPPTAKVIKQLLETLEAAVPDYRGLVKLLLSRLTKDLSGSIEALSSWLDGTDEGQDFDQTAREVASMFEDQSQRLEHGPSGRAQDVTAGYFVFALPVEQMAYYVNRSTALTYHDPSLRRIEVLATCLGWMAGIQFYLNTPLNIAAGHIVCMDSDWGLTAIEQAQFWRDIRLGAVSVAQRQVEPKAILSVDIADWDSRGRYVQKEAYNCTRDEIAYQVWSELKESLNERMGPARLRDDMLLGGPELQAGVNYNLDESIVDVYDRKKQALYERARGAMFDGVALAERVGFKALRHEAERSALQDDPLVKPDAASLPELPYVWGAARELNAEPLLINYAGTLAFRPTAETGIPNMFLAGDYVRTSTDLACMEGANEAARLAVNALLEAAGSLHPRCALWPLSVMTRGPFSSWLEGAPDGPARNFGARTMQAAGGMADLVAGMAGQAVAKWRERK